MPLGGGWNVSTFNGDIEVGVKDLSGNDTAYFDTTATNFADGNWHHVVAVITTNTTTNAGNTFIVYVDGVSQAGTRTAESSYVYAAPTSPMNFIGARNLTVARYFSGAIDEVRIYNRALSASEVQYLYNIGK
jgi:hypothetical protein